MAKVQRAKNQTEKGKIDVESDIKEDVLTLDKIKEKQEACIEKWSFIISDICLPMFDTISDIWFIIDLSTRYFYYALITLSILYVPIFVIIMHYFELHATRARPIWRKAMEICCLFIFGPAMDSISAIAFLFKGR